MQTRIARFILPAVLLTAGCGAVAWTWQLAQHIDDLQRAGDQTFIRIDRVDELLEDLDQRELTYTSSGRADAETVQEASSTLQHIVSESSSLVIHSLVAANTAAKTIAEHSATIAETDGRAQENLRAGLELMAADLVFTETHQPRYAMRQQLRALRAAEADALADARSRSLKQAWAGLGGVALLFAWALVWWSRRPVVASLPPGASGATPEDLPRNTPIHPVDLAAAADLCTAVGQLKAEGDLQNVLDRAKSVLGASGVVVWMGAGEELFPAASAGYDLRALTRLGPIFQMAVNATATAWRSGAFQAVAGDSSSQSAMVAPLLGPERCVGVLAIEVAPGCEKDVATRAVVTMIAAQLAAVLTAWPAASLAQTADVLPFDKTASASS